MKKYRYGRIAVCFVCLVMMVLLGSVSVYAETTSFKDVPSNAWYKADLESMVKTGLVKGYSDGTFRPEQEVTFSEFTMFLERARGNMNVENLYAPQECFNYLTGKGIMCPYDVAINAGAKHGGYQLTTTKTSRKLAAQILFGYYADGYYDWENFIIPFKDFNECMLLSANQDYRDQVAFCYVTGFMKGMSNTRYSPGTCITRAQAITIVKRIYDQDYNLNKYYVKGQTKKAKPSNAYFMVSSSSKYDAWQ